MAKVTAKQVHGEMTVALDYLYELIGSVEDPTLARLRFVSVLPIMFKGQRDKGGLVVYVAVPHTSPLPNDGGRIPDEVRAVAEEIARRINRP